MGHLHQGRTSQTLRPLGNHRRHIRHASDFPHTTWRKSRRSNGAGGNCVEVAGLAAEIGVRDSKGPRRRTPLPQPPELDRIRLQRSRRPVRPSVNPSASTPTAPRPPETTLRWPTWQRG
ncbi:DUF397 domain-containing protein [Actinomadura geliboluensis]|uniref:DUF397 domain-containing protein n=1 Tax=Actinomadura geliboluensis TaxID=882440 RepID=UPI0037131CBD